MIKTIVFDFDGVIVPRSEFYKQEAWSVVFMAYKESFVPHLKEAEAKYGGGRGGDRYDILRQTYRMLGEEEEKLEELVQRGATKFDAEVQRKILESGIPAATRELLKRLALSYQLYLNSATPGEALARTVSNLGISGFFADVLGRPNSKIDNLRKVAAETKASPQEIIFIGDGESDWRAAKEFGCYFVGLSNDWNKWKGKKPFPLLDSLIRIEAVLAQASGGEK